MATDYHRARHSYLQRRAVTGPWQLEGDSAACHGAVIIPALAEGDELFTTLNSLAANPAQNLKHWLVVVIVNRRASDSNAAASNQRDLERLRNYTGPLRLAWVDASSPGLALPDKNGGVGMARKIAADLLLPRLTATAPLIHLDADTPVANNYLPAIDTFFAAANRHAAVINYRHQPATDAATAAAITSYEIYLRCHVLGLRYAASPYAFHTIGSTMASTVAAYISAGGMNRRRGGEDFYFMQQLAKCGPVEAITTTCVYPSARISRRAPFGTGQIIAAGSDAVRYYPPQCYISLDIMLKTVNRLIDADAAAILTELERPRATHLGVTARFLRHAGFSDVWQQLCATHTSPQRRRRAFNEWFDALKTIRLFHYLDQHGFPRGNAATVLPHLLPLLGLPAASATAMDNLLETLCTLDNQSAARSH